MINISNWGQYPHIVTNLINFSAEEELRKILQQQSACIARGLGRCYGDSALSSTIISTQQFNRLLAFNVSTGELTCESGVSFAEILEHFVPRGWFLPVTPGTQYVTVGGALASDVHGKNHHHAGCFSNHVSAFDLILNDGTVVTCSREQNYSLFCATVSGMGLTGIILRVTFKLLPIETAYIKTKIIKVKNLAAMMDVFEQFTATSYSVAWIDCLAQDDSLGRGIVSFGEHAKLTDLADIKNPLCLPMRKKLTIPYNFPNFVLNPFSIKAFNSLYYFKQRKTMLEKIVDYKSFFYPLDGIQHWNRMYGKRGFTQYQLVLPKSQSYVGMKKILEMVSQSKQSVFLAVLKLLGPSNEGMLNFPQEGYTLAMDFPMSESLFPFLEKLDKVVLDHGGRLYLTKDARMSAELFAKSYPNAQQFKKTKETLDPQHKWRSLQSDRLII